MIKVSFSIAFGRPPGELRKRGSTVTWAAWWRSSLGARPDEHGGARDRAHAMALLNELALRLALPTDSFKDVGMKPARAWRKVMRAELPCNRPRPFVSDGQAGFAGFDTDPFSSPGARGRRPQASGSPWPQSPTPAATAIDPSLVALGLGHDASEANVQGAFRARARNLHPDRGGSEAAFKKLNNDYQRALKVVRGEIAAARFVYQGL